MRIILLTGNDREHRFVANSLCAEVEIDAIFVDLQPHQTNIRRALKQGRVISRIARKVYQRAIRDKRVRDQVLKRMLDGSDTFNHPERLQYIHGVNSHPTVTAIEKINPDVILVYGTSVIKTHVCNLAKDICLNMHTGVSPYYRGTGCAFFPIVYGDFHRLGATIHECISALDAGQIFDVVYVVCVPGDNLHTVFARTVIAGANSYARVVRSYLAGARCGVAQDLSLGREYRGCEYTLGAELKARWRLWQLAQDHARASQNWRGDASQKRGDAETTANRRRMNGHPSPTWKYRMFVWWCWRVLRYGECYGVFD